MMYPQQDQSVANPYLYDQSGLQIAPTYGTERGRSGHLQGGKSAALMTGDRPATEGFHSPNGVYWPEADLYTPFFI